MCSTYQICRITGFLNEYLDQVAAGDFFFMLFFAGRIYAFELLLNWAQSILGKQLQVYSGLDIVSPVTLLGNVSF